MLDSFQESFISFNFNYFFLFIKKILDGVVVPVKDEVDVAGYVTYVGTVMVQKHAERDAFIISELKKLGKNAKTILRPLILEKNIGAIIFGKTTMHEIGIGVSGHNQHWGLVRNAYNLSHYPGGSSSGSGVSVGTGMAPFAVAADGKAIISHSFSQNCWIIQEEDQCVFLQVMLVQ